MSGRPAGSRLWFLVWREVLSDLDCIGAHDRILERGCHAGKAAGKFSTSPPSLSLSLCWIENGTRQELVEVEVEMDRQAAHAAAPA